MLDLGALVPFAWPIAVFAIVFGVFFLWLFRDPISRLLDRTKSLSKEGIHTYDAQQSGKRPDALTVFLEGFHSPLLLEAETKIEENLKAQGFADSTHVRKVLVKMLAGALIFGEFQAIQSSIFASQLNALNSLNENPELIPKAKLKARFFDIAVTLYPEMYEHRTFDDWLGYLQHQTLIVETEKGVGISVRGREFLKWRVETGRPAPWLG